MRPSDLDFISPSGIDFGDMDILDAIELLSEEDQAAIAEGQSAAREAIEFAEAEQAFRDAVADLGAFQEGLMPGSTRGKDASGAFTDEALEDYFEQQAEYQDALQVARANYEAVGGKPETLLNQILGVATTVGAAPNVGSVAAGAGPFSQILYNIPSIAAGQPVVTGTYSQAGTQLPFEVGRKDGTIIAGTTGSEVLDQAVADVFGGEAIITETGDINVPSREDVTGAIGGIFKDPASGTLVKTAATTDTDTADEDTVVGVDTTKVALPGGADGAIKTTDQVTVDDVKTTDEALKTGGRDITAGGAKTTDEALKTGGRDIAGGDVKTTDQQTIKTGGRDIAGGDVKTTGQQVIKTGGRDIAGGDVKTTGQQTIKTGSKDIAGGDVKTTDGVIKTGDGTPAFKLDQLGGPAS
jgi:hypothetical protein